MNENPIEEATLKTLSQMLAEVIIGQMTTSELEHILFGVDSEKGAQNEEEND